MIPLDGKMGETTVDEAAATGEPIPKDKRPGAILFAGTLNKIGNGNYYPLQIPLC
jgi:Cd2+/Zn2+-exporting ATPase